MSRIVTVTPKEEYLLEVHLDNGSCIILNLKNKLETIRFRILSDLEFFQKVKTDGTCLTWDGKLEISLNEIFQLAQK